LRLGMSIKDILYDTQLKFKCRRFFFEKCYSQKIEALIF